MKLIHKDIKKGAIKVKIENSEDLWYLSNLIEEGDELKGKTSRKISYGGEEGKARVEKKIVFLKIKVDSVDFGSGVLRILGKVVDGPEEIGRGSHHSFELIEGVIISLCKSNWLKFQLDWLDEAVKSKVAKILICVMDRENAYFALSKKQGYDLLSSVEGDVQKKEERAQVKGKFYSEIIKVLHEYFKRYKPDSIVLASPAFFKEDLMKLLKDDILKKKIVLASCSAVGENGINEVLKRPEVESVLKKDRISKEMKLIEELLTEISKDGLSVYGVREVEGAVISGAVKLLMITGKFIQKKRMADKFKKIDSLMKNVEEMRGKVYLISSEHEGGKKLDGLGGIAGLLRYQLNY